MRQWRERLGVSQMQLGAAAGVSPKHVSFIENRRAHPSRAMLLTIARALDVPPRVQDEWLELAGYAPDGADRGFAPTQVFLPRRTRSWEKRTLTRSFPTRFSSSRRERTS